jgi:hypothetical protein
VRVEGDRSLPVQHLRNPNNARPSELQLLDHRLQFSLQLGRIRFAGAQNDLYLGIKLIERT